MVLINDVAQILYKSVACHTNLYSDTLDEIRPSFLPYLLTHAPAKRLMLEENSDPDVAVRVMIPDGFKNFWKLKGVCCCFVT